VWGGEDGDDVSTDSDNDDSGRLYDFVVAKTNDQEENIVARPGFKVLFCRTLFLGIDLSFSLVGRWTPHFFSIDNLRLASMSAIRTYLQGYYMEKLFKVL
jgi:hypothetical protein